MGEKKKILIVSRSFYPMNSPRSFRTTELAKEFARQGHEVKVLTPRAKEHSEFEKEYNLEISDLGQPKWKAIDLKGKGLELLGRRAIRRFSKLLFEFPDIELISLVTEALKKESNYDLLLSIAVPYPIHWGVAKARTKDHPIAETWIADCGDPYMGAENDTFEHPFYFKYVEKWFARKADFLTVPAEGSIAGYYPEFHKKIKVIPQGFNFESVDLDQDPPRNAVPTFAYAGSFIKDRRDPREFMKYLISQDQDFRFEVYTRSTDLIQQLAEESNGRIVIKKYIPRRELMYRLSQMDFLVNFENVGNKQTPSKLIDYAILEKPVISIQTGSLKKDTVDQFLQKDYSGQYMVENPDQYRIENVVERFLALTKE